MKSKHTRASTVRKTAKADSKPACKRQNKRATVTKVTALSDTAGMSRAQHRAIEHGFILGSYHDARALTEVLPELGYSVSAMCGTPELSWLIIAEKIGSIQQVADNGGVDELMELAERFNATYAGWRTSLRREGRGS